MKLNITLRNIIFILAISLVMASCGNGKQENRETSDGDDYYTAGRDRGGVVYVCGGISAKRYHLDENCKGLSRCSCEIQEMTVEEAKQMGRTPCRMCAAGGFSVAIPKGHIQSQQ